MPKLIDAADLLKQRGITEAKSLADLVNLSDEMAQVLMHLVKYLRNSGGDTIPALGVSAEQFAKIMHTNLLLLDHWATAHILELQESRKDTSLVVEPEVYEEMTKCLN